MSGGIVSLLASGTEIVDALGLGDRLVAISHECDFPSHLLGLPRASRPRFESEGLTSGEIDAAVRAAMADHGSVYAVDADLLEALDPDLILAQAMCEVCAVPTAGVSEIVAERGLRGEVLSLDAHTIDEILDSVLRVGVAAGHAGRARSEVDRLSRRLGRVRARVGDAPRPRVLAVEWLDPPFAPGHWVPEMIEGAGGDNLLGTVGRPSRQHDWEDLTGHDPDTLVVMPCGYGLEGARDDADRHARELTRVAPRAIAEGRAFVVDASSYFNRSGPRFVTGVEILAGLLHPGRAPTPPSSRAAVWSPS